MVRRGAVWAVVLLAAWSSPRWALGTTVTWQREYGATIAGVYQGWAYSGGHAGPSKPAFADIDRDGDLDLFLMLSGSLQLHENIGTTQTPGWKAPVLNYASIAGDNVAFGDIDGDGDLDLFIGVGSAIRFYQNTGTPQSAAWATPIENYASVAGNAPTLADIDADGDLDLFVGQSNGSVTYCQNVGSPTSPTWAAPVTNYASIAVGANSTPIFADIDGDGDLDLFIGASDGNIHFYENSGTSQSASWAAPVHQYGGINVGTNGAPALVDIDGDGDLDLFIGGQDSTGHGKLNSYENLGTSATPVWAAPLESYLWIDIGEDSFPALCDIDADGDLDLFISDMGWSFGRDSRIAFFKNVGTPQSPAWGAPILDYLGYRLGNDQLQLTCADIDADGDMDLFVSVNDFNGWFWFFENVGSPTSASWVVRANHYAGIATGSGAEFADMDADGDLDLVAGDWENGLFYYENLGSAHVPQWAELPVASYAGSSGWPQYIEPAVGDVDGDGDLDMICGHFGGGLRFSENIGTAQAAQWAAPVTGYLGINLGWYSAPELADIDGDGDPDLLAGEGGGGLYFFRSMTFTLQVIPYNPRVEFNRTQQFTVAQTTGTAAWTLVQNRSGGTIDGATGFYTAGPIYNVTDVIEVRDPATGDRGRAWVKVTPPPFVRGEKIIICAGGGNYPGNSILTQTNYLADYAFRMSLERGYTSESICYLNADRSQPHDADGDGGDDVDATATLAAVQHAITQWSSDTVRLFIYLVDHGTQTQFRVNETQFLDGPTFDSWLDTLQTNHATTVVVVADFCYSGSFIASCTAPPGRTRAVFTSAGSSELATFLAPYGYISFSNFFLGYAHSGANLFDCFAWTRDALNFTYAGQVPRIDDNGDGLSNKNDGYFARTQYWGFDYGYGATPPEIIEIAPDRVLNGETSATFRCVVVPTLAVDHVWVTILPPGLTFSGGEPITTIPQVELHTTGTTTYLGSWDGFTKTGQYTVCYYAIDVEGGLSWPRKSYIIQMSGPDTYEVDDTATQAKAIIFDWPQAQHHNIHDASDRDWVYAFLLGGASYRISATDVGSACDVVIEVYDSTTATVPRLFLDEWGKGMPEMRTWVVPTTGTYHILVHDFDPSSHGENTSYSLSVTGGTGANNGLAIALSGHHIRCSWDPATMPNLQGYHLMRTGDFLGQSWVRINPAPIAPGASPQFDDFGVEPATFYFYKALAICDSGTTRQCTTVFFTMTPESWQGIVVTGGPLAFGARDVDAGPTPSQTVTIRNDGAAPLNFTGAGIALTGPNANQFVITNSPPTTPLAPGTSRTVCVAFDPSTTGPKTADLTITTDDASEPTINVGLSGTAIDQKIAVSPMALVFGSRHVKAGPTPSQTATIRNVGNASLNFTGAGIALTGAHRSQFLIINSPATTPLAPGTSRAVSVAFDPSTTGPKTANLTITTDETTRPTVNVQLSGTGIEQKIAVSPVSLSFGNQHIRAGATTAKIVTIKNVGNASLNFTGAGIALTGGNKNQFRITNSPTTTPLAAGASRAVNVAFDPSTTGPKTANLTITTDDTTRPVVNVQVSGTGIAQQISVSPMSLSFGDWPINAGATEAKTVTIQNVGSAPLSFTGRGIALTGSAAKEFRITNKPTTTTLTVGASRPVLIVFDLDREGLRTASLTITTDDLTRPTVNVSLTGSGSGPTATGKGWRSYE